MAIGFCGEMAGEGLGLFVAKRLLLRSEVALALPAPHLYPPAADLPGGPYGASLAILSGFCAAEKEVGIVCVGNVTSR